MKMRRGFKRTGDPGTEPVTLDEAKAHLRIETGVTADDTLITALIVAARQWCEQYTGLAFITQTWQVVYDAGNFGIGEWWSGVREGVEVFSLPRVIELPYGPGASSVVITSYDDADSGTVFSSDNYFVDVVSNPPRIVLRQNAGWPLPAREGNGLVIQYVCGYGAASAVPTAIKTAIKMLIAQMYEQRGEDITGTIVAEPSFGVYSLLQPYRSICL